jgi:hypothetical protein
VQPTAASAGQRAAEGPLEHPGVRLVASTELIDEPQVDVVARGKGVHDVRRGTGGHVAAQYAGTVQRGSDGPRVGAGGGVAALAELGERRVVRRHGFADGQESGGTAHQVHRGIGERDDGAVELLRRTIKETPGYVAGFHLRDTRTNKALSVTVYEDTEALGRVRAALADRPAERKVGTDPDDVEFFEAFAF